MLTSYKKQSLSGPKANQSNHSVIQKLLNAIFQITARQLVGLRLRLQKTVQSPSVVATLLIRNVTLTRLKMSTIQQTQPA